MGLTIALALVSLGVLSVAGGGDEAWSVALVVLLLGCVISCGSATLVGRQTEREVQRTADALSRRRQDGKT